MARQVPFSSKLAYGVGQASEGIKNYALALFILYYYNNVLGLSGALCGLALLLALVFDAVTDPLTGTVSDRWSSSLGRRHPFMYASAVPLAIAFYLLFSPPPLGEIGLFVWLLTFAMLTRGAMTLFHVPHLSLGAEMSSNYEERTSIVAYRQAFSYLGSLVVVVMAFGYFFADARGGRLNLDAYPSFALLFSVLMAATILISAYGTRGEVAYLPRSQPSSGRSLWAFASDLRTAVRSGSFRWLFSGILVVYLMVGVDLGLSLYMYDFFWELESAQILALTVTGLLGALAGTTLTRAIHRRWDKKPALILGTAGWAVCQTLPVVLRLVDAFPENGTSALFVALLAFRAAQGVIVQQSIVSSGAMMADVVDEHELESGRRQEGVFFGANSFSLKAAVGLGGFLAGVGLDWIGWPAGEAVAGEVAAATLTRLGLLFGPFVCGFAVVSLWCYSRYRLDRPRLQDIQRELARRRTSPEADRPQAEAGSSRPAGHPRPEPTFAGSRHTPLRP